MRINPNQGPNILADIQTSQQQLNTALQQIATGKAVNVPSDNPANAAAMVQNTLESGNVDQYTKNINNVLLNVQTAGSALSNVVTSLTQAVTLGTEAANGSSTTDLTSIAQSLQGILTSVVQDANTSVGGAYLFSGTAASTKPFTTDSTSSSGYAYNGNTSTNSVEIGDQMNLQVNIPGSQIFSNASNNVLGALNTLVSAVQSGDTSQIQSATTAVHSALTYVSQQQVFYSNAASQLNAQDNYLQQDTVMLSTQQTNLIGVDMATAATNLAQAETANSAALAAAAKVLPTTLLNYLAPPQ